MARLTMRLLFAMLEAQSGRLVAQGGHKTARGGDEPEERGLNVTCALPSPSSSSSSSSTS